MISMASPTSSPTIPSRLRRLPRRAPLSPNGSRSAEKAIGMRRTGSFEEARAKVLKGDGLAAMRELREQLQSMQQREVALLEVRTASAQEAIYALSTALLVLFLGMARH